ncbi:MAG: 50S ribosomal protein L25/general stress protein Ctc [Alphaproteobacteria bacterium]|nr:50S ribosomal protein L25/general stress protein Ctc [Alphaproteobacteria bacterium]
MTKVLQIDAEIREGTGKGPARALRRAGKFPGVIYGEKKEPMSIVLPLKEVTKEYMKAGFMTKLVDIKVGKDTVRVLPRDVSLHPVTDVIEHADFLRVGKDTKVRVHVPIHFHGHEKSLGLKRGGVLNIVRHDVELICTPDTIPPFLDADITNVDIGHSLHISHVKLPDGVKPVISDRDFTIATIVGRAAEEEAKPAAEGAEGADAAAAPAAGAKAAAPAGGAKAAAPAAPAKK